MVANSSVIRSEIHYMLIPASPYLTIRWKLNLQSNDRRELWINEQLIDDLQGRERGGWSDRTTGRMARLKRSVQGPRSARNNWQDWRGNSRKIDIWPREGGNNSREIWDWTRRRSRSGSKIKERKSKRRAGRRIRSLYNWWPKVCTITRRSPLTRMGRKSWLETIIPINRSTINMVLREVFTSKLI